MEQLLKALHKAFCARRNCTISFMAFLSAFWSSTAGQAGSPFLGKPSGTYSARKLDRHAMRDCNIEMTSLLLLIFLSTLQVFYFAAYVAR